MTKRIYVGNLSSHTTERDLTSLFEQVGRVVTVRIMTDRDTGQSKGFGFVEMDNEEAEKAIMQLNRANLDGHALSVSEARPRPDPSAERGVPSVRLFVGNLPYAATGAELKEFFSSVGPVSSVILPVDRESGKPRGFAFVEFPDPVHAKEAVRRFHNQPFKGRPLVVNEARAPESRSSTNFPPRTSQSPMERSPAPSLDEQPFRKGGPSRHFGPDAAPHRNHKQASRSPKSERSRGKPIPERKGGQFFGTADEEPYGDTFTEEQFTNQMSDPESGERP
jgi:RNA recognition motif-containing protein